MLLVFVAPSLSRAYEPNWLDVVDQFQDKISWTRSIYEVKVEVFDPFRPESSNLPVEIPDRAYQQLIHWKMDEYLTVETKDLNGALLHYYYEVEGTKVEAQISQTRRFALEEIRPYYLGFFSKDPEQFRYALEQVDIPANAHSLFLAEDGNVYHRFGLPDEGPYLLMNTAANRLESLNYPFFAPDGSMQYYRILFKDFTEYRRLSYPKVIEFTLGEKLFQRRTIERLNEPSRLPWQRLKQLADDHRSRSYGSLTLDFQN